MPDKYANAHWGPSFADDAARDPRDEDPTLDELTALLHNLAATYPTQVILEQIGESVAGNPLWLVEVSDRTVPDEDKQIAFFLGCEHGNEHSGGTALLHVLRWLVTPEAAEIRRCQRVLMIPVVSPDGYETYHQSNMNGVNLYADYSLTGPPSQPESRAVWGVMERYAPEVVGCCHGHWRNVRTYAFENCQGAYGTSRYDRTHARLFAEEVNRACEEAGYPQDRMEEDSERLLPPLPGFPNQSARSGDLITPGVYAYHRFHTMLFSMEIMYEESGLVKIRKILELGNQPWRYERTPGYPVRVMTPPEGHAVVAYGTTAAERRASRLELWRHNDAIVRFGLPTVEDPGFVGFGFSIYPEDHVLGDTSAPPLYTVGEVLDHFESDPNIDMPPLREAFGNRQTAGWSRYQEPPPDQPSRLDEIRHGISMRVRLLPGSKVKRLLVNGREVGPSEREGYEAWTPPGGATIMQLNLPGGKSAGAADGHLRRVICALEYQPGRVGKGL
jgi:hypothetical protein